MYVDTEKLHLTATPCDEPLNEAQAAQFLHQKPRTLRLWRRTRGLPYYKVTSKIILYSRSDLLRWLEQRRVQIAS